MGLSLTTFGRFTLQDEVGAERSLPTRKTRALLAYLAVNADKPQPRERLMALLWSDRSEQQARQSLNDALKPIRRLSNDGGPALLDSDGEQVTLHGAALESDVGRFQAIVDADPASAAALYDGPFLDGLSVPDPAFEEWLTATQSALHADACDALWRAAERASDRGDSDDAINKARRLVALDPLREDAYRLLMRLLYAKGDRVGALQQYKACAEILDKELQIAPDAATQALLETIRQDAPAPEPDGMMARAPAEPAAQTTDRSTSSVRRNRLIAAVAACVLLVVGVGAILWFMPWTNRAITGGQETAVLPLPNKPSIAVMPFTNLSGDPKQDYFVDGIVEDIITRLARRPDMLVIAHMSSFSYKGKSFTAQQVGRALGVRYLLEGSIQKSAYRIRITAQLIEAATGRHLWAESYDRMLEKVFSVQDEIARRVAAELAAKLTIGEIARSDFQAAKNIEAYDYFLRGEESYRRSRKEADNEAKRFFEKAIALDPHYARALARLAWVHLRAVRTLQSKDIESSISKAVELAHQAIAIDKNSAFAYMALSRADVFGRRYDKAITEGRRAIEIEPNNAILHAMFAVTNNYAGRLKDASVSIDRALRLAPYPPIPFLGIRALTYYRLGQYEASIAICRRALARRAESRTRQHCYLHIIASYMALGREAEAHAEAQVFVKQNPTFSISKRIKVLNALPYPDRSWIVTYAAHLRQAGLPN